MVGINTPESTVEFLMILGLFLWQCVKDAAGRIALGVNPWNAKIFFSGCANLLFIILGVVVVLWVFIDGFGRHFKRDCFLGGVLFILYIISCIK